MGHVRDLDLYPKSIGKLFTASALLDHSSYKVENGLQLGRKGSGERPAVRLLQ